MPTKIPQTITAKVFAQFNPKAARTIYSKWVGPDCLIKENQLTMSIPELCTESCNYIGTLDNINDLWETKDPFEDKLSVNLQSTPKYLRITTQPDNDKLGILWDRAGLQHCHIAVYVEELSTLFVGSGWLQSWNPAENRMVFSPNVPMGIAKKS